MLAALTLVPLAMALLAGLLVLATWLERNVVSPRALISRAVDAHTPPEVAERLVAVEAARLLSGASSER